MASNYFTDRHRVTHEDSASTIIVKLARNFHLFPSNGVGQVVHRLDVESFSTTCDM